MTAIRSKAEVLYVLICSFVARILSWVGGGLWLLSYVVLSGFYSFAFILMEKRELLALL